MQQQDHPRQVKELRMRMVNWGHPSPPRQLRPTAHAHGGKVILQINAFHDMCIHLVVLTFHRTIQCYTYIFYEDLHVYVEMDNFRFSRAIKLEGPVCIFQNRAVSKHIKRNLADFFDEM